MANHKFKTTNIKGKEYVEVNERIKFFRTDSAYKGWALTTEIHDLSKDSCVIKASVLNDKGVVVATGYAQEDKASSFINKTSFVENCETSAWGRALANLGIGIDTSIASSDEVDMAIKKQELQKSLPQQGRESKPTPPKEKFETIDELKEKFVGYIKTEKPTNGTIKKLVQNTYKKGIEPLMVTAWLKEAGCDMVKVKEVMSNG